MCAIVLKNNNITDIGRTVPAAISNLIQNHTVRFPSGKEILQIVADKGSLDFPDSLRDADGVFSDPEQFFSFMEDCGNEAQANADSLLSQSVATLITSSQELSFDWIRCFDGADGTRSFRGGQLTPEQRSVEGQTDWFTRTWELDRQRLFDLYYLQLIEDGFDQTDAFKIATQEAARDANGGSECNLNAPAAGELSGLLVDCLSTTSILLE